MNRAGGARRTGPGHGTLVLRLTLLLAPPAALCWAYLLLRSGRLAGLGAGLPQAQAVAPYRAADLALLYALWMAVIAATMLPAAAPSVLLYARIKWLHRERRVVRDALAFVLGQLAVWSGCGLAAALVDWALHDAGALDDAMAIAHPAAGALALVAAGVYQWTPAKHACLDNCRAPPAFVLAPWRRGAAGAFRMGAADARHGIGCCWLLLALVVPAGVLNLAAIAGLIVLILAEKRLPGGHLLACATGPVLVAWGTALLFP